MQDNTSAESIRTLIEAIDGESLHLPEFQRDFVWETSKTLELLDSIVREVFIGSVIYGVPSFSITVREIDDRPREGKGSRRKLAIKTYSEERINKLSRRRDGFRLILDGQQRITSLYRAFKGIDPVYFIAKSPAHTEEEVSSLERSLEEFAVSEHASAVSIRLSDVWKAATGDAQLRMEKGKRLLFAGTKYGSSLKERDFDCEFSRFLRLFELLQDLVKSDKFLSYYLLDTTVEKFALFFERSNSRGIRLSFADILAAKLYGGFNLRQQIDDFSEDGLSDGLVLNEEHVIRVIAFIASNGQEVKKPYILQSLQAEHFKRHWDSVARVYSSTFDYLLEQKYFVLQRQMPYDNMMVPLMIFALNLPSRDWAQATREQLEFLRYWYWSSVFSERYSAKTNEVIVEDSNILAEVARGKNCIPKDFDRRFIPKLRTAIDIQDLRATSSALFKGLIAVAHHCHGGLLDWTATRRISRTEQIDLHHIFPKKYMSDGYQGEAADADYVESVANVAYVPKITNIKIGKRKPSDYLSELRRKNSKLETALSAHAIPAAKILAGKYDNKFRIFVKDRSEELLRLVRARTTEAAKEALRPVCSEST